MSEPVSPAAPAAPTTDAAPQPAAPPTAVAQGAAAPAVQPRKHPYGVRKAAAPTQVAAPATAPAVEAPAAPAADAKPAPQKGSRVLALRERELASLKSELSPLRERQAAYEKALAPLAERELESLPAQVREALSKKHGKDSLALIDEVNYLRSLGLIGATAKPATTAAPPVAVSQAPESDADLSALRTYERLEKQSRTLAVDFHARNRAAIERGRAKASAH